MMQLRSSTTSPYVRKCQIIALETGLSIKDVPTSPWAADTDLFKDNPLNKVPTLVTEGGEALFDSRVICEYLDSLHTGRKLIPLSGGERWRQLRLAALADGMLDAAVGARLEATMRPEDKRWPDWIARQERAMIRGFDTLEQECTTWGDEFLIGQIGVVVAIDYIAFRAIVDWSANRPNLVAWHGAVSRRPSVAATLPKD